MCISHHSIFVDTAHTTHPPGAIGILRIFIDPPQSHILTPQVRIHLAVLPRGVSCVASSSSLHTSCLQLFNCRPPFSSTLRLRRLRRCPILLLILHQLVRYIHSEFSSHPSTLTRFAIASRVGPSYPWRLHVRTTKLRSTYIISLLVPGYSYCMFSKCM